MNKSANVNLAEWKQKVVGCSGNVDKDPLDTDSDVPELIDLAYRFRVRVPRYPLARMQRRLAQFRGLVLTALPESEEERKLVARRRRLDAAIETLREKLELRSQRYPELAHDLARLGIWAERDAEDMWPSQPVADDSTPATDTRQRVSRSSDRRLLVRDDEHNRRRREQA